MEEKENRKESVLSQWKGRKKRNTLKNGFEKAPLDAVIPLSHGQEQLWFLQQLYPDNPFYNYAEVYLFKGNLNCKYLELALGQILTDHDILKSVYVTENGKSIQKIKTSLTAYVTHYDFSSFSGARFEREMDQLSLAEAKTKFSLSKGPLFKFTLVKCQTNEHRLLVTFNHLITDKWSMKVFREHLAAHYVRLSKGLELVSLRPEFQYADYAYYYRNMDINAAQLSYWKNKLNNKVPPVTIPLDHERPATPSFRGALHSESYSSEISTAILNMAKRMEATPFTIFLSAFHLLLYKHGKQQDISVGTPVANRNYTVLEDLIGFFNDTLVLRTQLTPDMKFSDLVSAVRKTSLEAFANRDVPFDVLVKTLNPERKSNLNPFFQVMFIYHAVPANPHFTEDLEIVSTPSEVGVAKFDLTLYVAEEKGRLSATIEYASDLFEAATIIKLQKELREIFRTVLRSPEFPVKAIVGKGAGGENFSNSNLMPSNEVGGNMTLLVTDKGIHAIIAQVARENPDKLAVTFKGNSITYKELNNKAEKLAKYLIDRTKGTAPIIGLCLNRSIEMIVGILGILKAGSAYLPIDPEYPEQRIRFMISDADAKFVLTEPEYETLFETAICDIIFLDEKPLPFSKAILPKVSNEQLAYVIYTSGSTGKPKGVPISHQNIITSTLGRLDFYEKRPSAFLLLSSIAFDSSKAGLFWTLITGGNLVVSEKRIEQDIFKIGQMINEHKVSHTLMLPTLYGLLLEHSTADNLKCLNTVIVAGEACSAIMVKRHFEKLSHVALYNEYGPTEATVWCIAHKIEKGDLGGIIPIGKAVAQAQVYLLTADMKEVNIGEIGQIYIGGTCLSGTYINRPDLAQSAYIENPYSKEKPAKLYRTGDLGRYRSDGCIEFLGRADEQVKIRGHRIEIEEIEQVLLSNKRIVQAVVVVEGDPVLSSEDIKRDASDEDLLQLMQSQLSQGEIDDLLADIKENKR